MNERRCPTCGQPTRFGEHGGPPRPPTVGGSSNQPVLLGESEHELELTELRGSTGGDDQGVGSIGAEHRSRRFAPAIAALAAMAVLILALLAVGGDDPADDETTSDGAPVATVGVEPTTIATTTAEQDEAPTTQEDDIEVGGPAADFPPSDEHLQEEAVTEFFASVPSSPDDYLIAYPAEGGIKVITTSGLFTTEPANVVGFRDAEGFPMFGDGDSTWAVDSADPTSTWIVSRNYEVVDIGLEGAIGFVNYDDLATVVGVSSFGSWGPGFTLPIGTDVVAAQGIGLLVLPETGGTLVVTPTGLEPFSDDRVVAATGQRVVIQTCDERLQCELFVIDDEGERSQSLPIVVGTDLVVSPDGAWVFVDDPLGLRLVEVGDDLTDVQLSDRPASMDAVAWAPDSSFAAWLVDDELHVVIPSQQWAGHVALSSPPASPALLVADLDPNHRADDNQGDT